jgi:hypothetical protein
MQSARLLERELQYQADNIISAVDRGSADLVGAVQIVYDYLGGQLCEVRWGIEREAQVSKQILQVLITALDNTSRQGWEQGVKCYDSSEYEIAQERFSRALNANRTNYFAYQYPGLIAVHNEDEQEAVKNFDLLENPRKTVITERSLCRILPGVSARAATWLRQFSPLAQQLKPLPIMRSFGTRPPSIRSAPQTLPRRSVVSVKP